MNETMSLQAWRAFESGWRRLVPGGAPCALPGSVRTEAGRVDLDWQAGVLVVSIAVAVPDACRPAMLDAWLHACHPQRVQGLPIRIHPVETGLGVEVRVPEAALSGWDAAVQTCLRLIAGVP